MSSRHGAVYSYVSDRTVGWSKYRCLVARETHMQKSITERTQRTGDCAASTHVSPIFSRFLDLNTLDILNRKSKTERKSLQLDSVPIPTRTNCIQEKLMKGLIVTLYSEAH